MFLVSKRTEKSNAEIGYTNQSFPSNEMYRYGRLRLSSLNTAGLPKFTHHLRSFRYLPGYLIGIFIGYMLGDAYMDNRPGIFSLKQSIINFPFI